MIKSKSCERRVRVSRSRRDVESQLRPGRSARRGFPRFHPIPREGSTLSSVRPSSSERLAITGSARERTLQSAKCKYNSAAVTRCVCVCVCVCLMSKWRIARWFFQRWVRQRPPLPHLQFLRTRSRYLSAGTAATRRWERFNNNPVVEQFPWVSTFSTWGILGGSLPAHSPGLLPKTFSTSPIPETRHHFLSTSIWDRLYQIALMS